MKKIIILAICFTLLTATRVYSQQESYLSINYAVSFAVGDMGDYISAVSWRGAQIEYRAAIKDNLLAGVDLGWNVFYQKKDYDTYTVGTESLSGVQFRYQNEVPILASFDYLISSDKSLKPYVGLGIGTIYSERNTQMNLYYLEENSWQFAMKGELGLLYELSYHTSLKVAAKYYNGFKTGTLNNQGYFSISAGMAFVL
jgi:outer membrane protein W